MQSMSSVSGDGTVRTWDVLSGEKIFETDVGDLISAAAWNPDGTQLAYALNSEDTEVGLISIVPFEIKK
jgi:WD40 repeat protein